MIKLKKNDVNEIDRYFSPKSQIVDKLPDPKSVRDFTKVYVRQSDGSYKVYEMLEGNFKLKYTVS